MEKKKEEIQRAGKAPMSGDYQAAHTAMVHRKGMKHTFDAQKIVPGLRAPSSVLTNHSPHLSTAVPGRWHVTVNREHGVLPEKTLKTYTAALEHSR